MLLRDDVVADRQAEPRPFTRRLRGEKGLEQLGPHFRLDAGPVVADFDLYRVAEITRGDPERRPIAGSAPPRWRFLAA